LVIPAHLIIVAWIIWVINMVKLTKGASQLPGMVFFAFLTISAVALKYAYGSEPQLATAYMSLIMAGSVLAFVPFNFPPERMFPGDSASAFIGFMLGVLSIISGGKLATAILVLSIPAIDLIAIVITRLMKRQNPLTHGGKDHLYHKLMALGIDKKIVIFIYWLLTALMGVISIWLNNSQEKLFVLAVVVAITMGLFLTIHVLLSRRIDGEKIK
jgi:UDP-GlcNAc:undecaprenyl-phosphate GlcNAc-1-phosphate transferase